MNVFAEKSRSLWMAVAPVAWPALGGDLTVDVAVIGAGIAGLATAYELVRTGRTVAVLDRGPIGRGMTARTTAHLVSGCDDYLADLIARRDEHAARAYHESQAAAIDRIEAVAAEEGIACDFARIDGWLFAATAADEERLDGEVAAARRIGWHELEKLPRAPFRGLAEGPALRYPAQGRFHPLKYVDGLAAAIARRGGRLFAGTTITRVHEQRGGVRVETASGHSIHADSAVVATNSPIGDTGALYAKEVPFRTYALAAEVPKGLPDALLWDTAQPYHYVRLQPLSKARDALIVGGEDHKAGTAVDIDERLDRLEEWARERFPQIEEIGWRWSGQVLEPADFMPFIGRSPDSARTYVVSGDSGQGVTAGVVASLMISEMIATGHGRWATAYDPARQPVGALKAFVAQQAGAARAMVEKLTPGEISSAEALEPGDGGLLRSGAARLAVCRDEAGRLHRHSAACSHLGCTVHWNAFEQCWDCPCHGSQFAPDGTALNAPAIAPLAPAE